MKSRAPDDLVVTRLANDQRATGAQRLLEEGPKWLLLISIRCRVLLPDQRVGRHGKQRFEIFGVERPEFDELAFQGRLEIDEHGCVLDSCRSHTLFRR